MSRDSWHCERVSDTAPAEWLPLPDVAARLDLSISKVNQMVRDGSLLAVRRDGVLRVPAELVANPTVLKHLPGVITLLHDAGFNDEEALRWLYTADETLPDVADRLNISIVKVNQLIKDGSLIAVRRDGIRQVPAELVANETVLKHLPGVLTLLHDAGFNDEEALRWLYTEDDTLPGTPAVALGGDKAREVKRRAQAVAF